MIIKGDKILIKENLTSELRRMGFDELAVRNMKSFIGTEQIAYDVYNMEDEQMVTIALCCEVPINCCEKI